MNPIYLSSIPVTSNKEEIFNYLLNDLDWLSVTPARKEYFMADTVGLEYKYGFQKSVEQDGLPIFFGKSFRSYTSKPYTEQISAIRKYLDETYSTNYNVCFFNRYDTQHNSLGWHADNSPEMNPDHPICVVSFGAERQIWWKKLEDKGVVPEGRRQTLESGSLFIMPAGFQQEYLHRIPKGDREMGCRISLTFRNYI